MFARVRLLTMDETETADVAYATFSVRLPGDLLRELEKLAKERVWSRNRTIEQAIKRGLPKLAEARRG